MQSISSPIGSGIAQSPCLQPTYGSHRRHVRNDFDVTAASRELSDGEAPANLSRLVIGRMISFSQMQGDDTPQIQTARGLVSAFSSMASLILSPNP
jgi:hypothetical protein